jgi:hypothetical protein
MSAETETPISQAHDGDAGASVTDRLPDAAQRPEVIVGAAFGGAFVLARILKKLFA